MMELPISKDIKEYYKKQNKEFTDSEKATIFWNSMLPCNEKLTALKEIMESTADEILKEQIQKRLETEAEKEKLFMLHDSDYVHSVILDDGKGTDGVFHSIDAAILYGKENCKETFEIRKDLLEDKAEMDTDENVLLGGKAEFKKDGTIVSMNNKREVQLPDISPHILRHTCTTRLAEAGCDIKVLQYIIGHTDIRTTMRVYNHVDEGRVKREMDKLEELDKKLTPESTPIYTKFTPNGEKVV